MTAWKALLNDWRERYGNGEINVLSNETNNLPFDQKLRIAGAIIKNSEIPVVGMGMGNDKGLTLDFNRAIFESLPDASKYYKARAEQLIPFDVPVIIEEPN